MVDFHFLHFGWPKTIFMPMPLLAVMEMPPLLLEFSSGGDLVSFVDPVVGGVKTRK